MGDNHCRKGGVTMCYCEGDCLSPGTYDCGASQLKRIRLQQLRAETRNALPQRETFVQALQQQQGQRLGGEAQTDGSPTEPPEMFYKQGELFD
jgi:hypothetical protein